MSYQVIAVTLNPALDVTLWAKEVDFEEPVKTYAETVYAGGKAVNVSRVLTSLGVKNCLTGIAAKNNLATMEELLKQDQVEYHFVSPPGSIRENVTLCLDDGKLLKINRTGPEVGASALAQVAEKIRANLSSDTILVFSGGKPPNLTEQDYKSLVLSFSHGSNRLAVDNDVFSRETMEEIHPFFIKPNYLEFNRLMRCKGMTRRECVEQLQRATQLADHVLVSMGADGGLYANGEGVYHITPPKVAVKSTIGAGDTTLACFLTACLQGNPYETSARYAVAGGTASVQLDGTDKITPEQWRHAIAQTTMEKIK